MVRLGLPIAVYGRESRAVRCNDLSRTHPSPPQTFVCNTLAA